MNNRFIKLKKLLFNLSQDYIIYCTVVSLIQTYRFIV